MSPETRGSRRHRPRLRLLVAGIGALCLSAAACGDRAKRTGADDRPDPEPPQNAAEPTAEWDGDIPFEVPVVRYAEDEGQVTIDVVRRAGVTPPPGGVSYTDEPYNISGTPDAPEVREADVLGTGLALDLDGDGEATAKLPVSCHPDGAGRVGDTRLVPLSRAATPEDSSMQISLRGPDGQLRIGRIGERGAHVVLYAPCERSFIDVGLSPPDRPIEVHTTDGPALQVLVFEPVARVDAAGTPGLTVRAGSEADIVQSWIYSTMFSAEPSWSSMRWAMVPLDAGAERQRVLVELPDDGTERMVVAAVNISPEPGVRLRYPFGRVAVPGAASDDVAR